MAKIYDLSVSLRPDHLENSELKLNSISHQEAARIFAKRYQVKVSDLPHGSFFSTERIELRSHLGTHLDAPYHFYPTSEGRPAKFIEEVPLEWCIADGVVLDFRHKKPSEYITEYDIAAALERIHYTLKPGDIVSLWTGGTDHYTISVAEVRGKLEQIKYRVKNQDIVLIRTGAAGHFSDDPNFADLSIRLELDALLWLLDQGVRVIGCDTESLDGPVTPMVEALRAGRKDQFFPIHYAGRQREFCLIHKMDLGSLPSTHGFKVVAFPIKLERCSAAWTRAVALVAKEA